MGNSKPEGGVSCFDGCAAVGYGDLGGSRKQWRVGDVALAALVVFVKGLRLLSHVLGKGGVCVAVCVARTPWSMCRDVFRPVCFSKPLTHSLGHRGRPKAGAVPGTGARAELRSKPPPGMGARASKRGPVRGARGANAAPHDRGSAHGV